MSKVTVCQFTMYDISSDEKRKSRRWGTLEAIAHIGGEALTKTATEVDASALDPAMSGMTVRDFDPHKRGGGFQRTVTT